MYIKFQNKFIKLLVLSLCLLSLDVLCAQNISKRKSTVNMPYDEIKIGERVFKVKKIKGVNELLSVEKFLKKQNEFKLVDGNKEYISQDSVSDQPDKIYENETLNTDSPYINAESVNNSSIFEALSGTDIPYHFFNTKYFTNSGTFKISNNFDFRTYETYVNLFGQYDFDPITAKVFNNKAGAVLESDAPNIVNSFIKIHADKIINHGKINAADAGVIELNGNKIDLNNGSIGIGGDTTYDSLNDRFGDGLLWGFMGDYQLMRLSAPGEPGKGAFVPQFGFVNVYSGVSPVVNMASGVIDGIGGAGDISVLSNLMSVEEVWSQYPILGWYSPPYGSDTPWLMTLGGDGFTPYVWEDFFQVADNEFVDINQVVYVRVNDDENFEFDVKMWPWVRTLDIEEDNLEFFAFGTPVIEFKTTKGLTNVLTGTNKINSLYVMDETGSSETKWNWGMTNILSVPITSYQQADSFVYSKYTPYEFQYGNEPNSEWNPDLFFFTSEPGEGYRAIGGIRVTNITSNVDTSELNFRKRRAFGSDQIVTLPFVEDWMYAQEPWMGRSELPLPKLDDIGALDQPGNVKIIADELDLTDTRIRAEGGITIKTKNLISSSGAALDCQNFILDLGKIAGPLIITNIVPAYVERLSGTIETYSVAWKTGGNFSVGEDENSVRGRYFATIVDANLQMTNRVYVVNARFQSPEKIVVWDPITISDNLQIDGPELIINNYFELSSDKIVQNSGLSGFSENKSQGLTNWDKNVAPNLKNLINNGNFIVPDVQDFGFDRNIPYENWINNGTNSAFIVKIYAENLENNGAIRSGQNIQIKTKHLKFDDSYVHAKTDMVVEANNVKFGNQTNIVGGKLVLDVSNTMNDGGSGITSYIQVNNDIELKTLPEKSNLIGTTIHAVATNFTQRVISWPAENRGLKEIGYNNNLALGSLILTNSFTGNITLKGKDKNNAIYIDYLNIESYTENDLKYKDEYINNFKNINIDEDFMVYFASSNLPEEALDGMYNGRLRWIKEYPGIRKNMPLYISSINKTITVNKPFRESAIYDTDNDGIANGYDLSPFGDGIPRLSIRKLFAGKVNISWLKLPGIKYKLQYIKNIDDNNWENILITDSSSEFTEYYSTNDKTSNKNDSRYYRVISD